MKSDNDNCDSLGIFNLSESDTFYKHINSYFNNIDEDQLDCLSNKPDYNNYDNPIDYIPFNGTETPSYLLYNNNDDYDGGFNLSNDSNSQCSNDSLEMIHLDMISRLLDTTQHNYSNDPSECFFNADNDDNQLLDDNINNGVYSYSSNDPFDSQDNLFDSSNEVDNQLQDVCYDYSIFDGMGDYASDTTAISAENAKELKNSNDVDKDGGNAKKNAKLNSKKINKNSSVSDVYVSWIPKNARCKLMHELPCDVEECEKYPEYIVARDKMLVVLKKLGFFHVESITFHPPKGSHIIIRFLNKRLETIFLQRYRETPHQWKLDMYKHFKISKKVIGSIKNLRVDTVNKHIKNKNAK